MRVIGSLALGSLVLVGCNASPEPIAPAVESRGCIPSYRWLSDDPLSTSGESAWLFTFSIALVGCAGDLERISANTIEDLRAEFEMPVEWSLVELAATDDRADLRRRMVNRVNRALQSDVVTDVVICCVGVVDHNPVLDGT